MKDCKSWSLAVWGGSKCRHAVPGQRLKVTIRGGKTLGEAVRYAEDQVHCGHPTQVCS